LRKLSRERSAADDPQSGYGECSAEWRKGRRAMADFFLSPTFVIMLLLFYWVPFAAGAWLVDVWSPRHSQRTSDELSHPKRHIRLDRPITA
jgi:hypothetical protein